MEQTLHKQALLHAGNSGGAEPSWQVCLSSQVIHGAILYAACFPSLPPTQRFKLMEPWNGQIHWPCPQPACKPSLCVWAHSTIRELCSMAHTIRVGAESLCSLCSLSLQSENRNSLSSTFLQQRGQDFPETKNWPILKYCSINSVTQAQFRFYILYHNTILPYCITILLKEGTSSISSTRGTVLSGRQYYGMITVGPSK